MHKLSLAEVHRIVILGLDRIVFMFLNVFEIFRGGFASRNTGSKEYRVETNLFGFSLPFRGRFHQKRK